jgi:predicted GNAT family acetyltransferase
VQVVRHTTALEFLAATEGFRAAHPVLTNVIGSVATGVASGRRYEAEMWLSVSEDSATGPVGIAMRTAPHNLVVSPMPMDAARELGRHLAEVDPNLPGVTGESDVCHALLEGLDGSNRARIAMTERVRVLQKLISPQRPVRGRARRIDSGDLELVADWLVRFAVDANLNVRPTRDSVLAELDSQVVPSLWLWEQGGEPLSLAGHAPRVPTPAGMVGRIGPVYTPERYRGRGYGTAITHAVSDTLRQECAIVMLYTDAANFTSNSVYERLGFDVVADVVELQLAPRVGRITGER